MVTNERQADSFPGNDCNVRAPNNSRTDLLNLFIASEQHTQIFTDNLCTINSATQWHGQRGDRNYEAIYVVERGEGGLWYSSSATGSDAGSLV